METSIRVAAPAKVNLHLRIRGKRADGFHDLRSLFQAVSLEDDIVIRSLKTNDSIAIEGAFDCPPESTTLHKAVLAFRAATGLTRGVSLKVSKRIPAGAGLGGASSDAASAIRALDALFGSGLPLADLAGIGAAVGSDVPFFLHGGAALVEGRGELVEPIPARTDLELVVAWPGLHVATPWAFGLLDRVRPSDAEEPDPSAAGLRAAYAAPVSAWDFGNSFSGPVIEAFPAIGKLRDRLAALGADFARMSGSGAAVFGVFPDAGRAERAAAVIGREARAGLLPASTRAWAVRALARLPTLG